MKRRCWAVLPVTLLAAGCGSHVAMPADDASPKDVVLAYVDAVHHKDCDTAAKLSRNARLWCGKADLTQLHVKGISEETKEGSPATRVKRVLVDFQLIGGDGSMSAGTHDWSYLLDRSGPNGAWRIYDEGMG